MVRLPEAEHSTALRITGEEIDSPSRDPELMLVLNWERNASCGPLPGGTEQPSGQCPEQQLDKPKTPFTHGCFLLAFRQIMFISLFDYERHTGMPVS